MTKLEDNIDRIEQNDLGLWKSSLKVNIFFVEWLVENYLTQHKTKKKEIKKGVKVMIYIKHSFNLF